MKKLLFILTAVVLTLTTTAQKKGHHVIIPGNGKLDLEQFIRPIDTNMDISQLSLAELRILRNGLAARQGHIFMDATLRSMFEKTSWYDSLMWKRFEKTEKTPNYGYGDNEEYHNFRHLSLDYTKEEQAFIERIQ
ncbi:MAG: YARHG domain-containing protein, partial [Prevotella sp.]|nr:YARHG domain-containing protein [Prevotella sp.]